MAYTRLLPLALLLSVCLAAAQARWPTIRLPSERAAADEDDSVGTRWAVLVAGSNGYYNYRHQADICHAYQIMKKGGLKDENIIVFMYDDIAHNLENPRPGVIINHPQGGDVYAGVPKDYTGKEVNVKNFFAVLLGNKTAVSGGSGKVVDSGPDDHIFIFYSDHGGPGVLGMPTYPYLYSDDLVDVLKKKHAAGTYKSLVFYLEACESGSIFEGLLPNDINVYATTASNAEESSWGTYCPGDYASPPPEYDTCLGDLYSISWMEDRCDADFVTVHIPAACEVGYRDGSELRFATTVAGTLDKGRLTEVEGLKTKVLVWARVTTVKADAAKVHFTAGIKKSRSRDAYEVVRGAITVDEF